MRSIMLRRRRRARIKALIYAAILATNPTVFVPMEYAVNPDTGEQILFQDSGATVPVTEIGQPIGAVVWDGVIVVLQTTDAARPTWGGLGVGAIFDGTQHLIMPDTTQFGSSMNQYGAILSFSAPSLSDVDHLFGVIGDDETDNQFLRLRKTSAALDTLELGIRDIDSRRLDIRSGTISSGQQHVAALSIDNAEENQGSAWIDNTKFNTIGNAANPSSFVDFNVDMALGALNIRGAVSSHSIVNIKAVVLYDRALSDSIAQAVTGALA